MLTYLDRQSSKKFGPSGNQLNSKNSSKQAEWLAAKRGLLRPTNP